MCAIESIGFPSSSESSRSIHPASLVDSSIHSPILLQLLEIKLSDQIIEYVVGCVADTVECAIGRPSKHMRQSTTTDHQTNLYRFTSFATRVLTRAGVIIPVILTTLAYLDRAKPQLEIALEELALERVFLGALIAASKYTNDATLKNIHWASCTGTFNARDVGLIEREFLDVLDWKLGISDDDLLAHHAGISAVLTPSSQRHHQCSVPYPHNLPARDHAPCPDLESPTSTSSDESGLSSRSFSDHVFEPAVSPFSKGQRNRIVTTKVTSCQRVRRSAHAARLARARPSSPSPVHKSHVPARRSKAASTDSEYSSNSPFANSWTAITYT